MGIAQATAIAREQTRARYPDADDPVQADGATRTAHLIAQLL